MQVYEQSEHPSVYVSSLMGSEGKYRGHLTIRDGYKKLYRQIDQYPDSEVTWNMVIKRALQEEEQGIRGKGFYADIPLQELLVIGQKLRADTTQEERYNHVSTMCSTGDRWYDILLGRENNKVFQAAIETIEDIQKIRKFPWMRGLDIGSGFGSTTEQIAPFCKKVDGLDKLFSSVSDANKSGTLPNTVMYTTGDAFHMPFPKRSFDLVVSHGMTHYFSKDQERQYIREVSRVTQTHGLYVEPWSIPKKYSYDITRVDEDYLGSAKGLLVDLIGGCIANQAPQEHLGLKETVLEFQQNGLQLLRPPDKDVFVTVYQKQ
jgi:ubiquinone/menaquinone biosynthesis C-methylase UbiE